jgi:hypothetical protein
MPAPGSIDQKNPLVNPDLERKGNTTMSTTADTGDTSPNPGLARPTNHRDVAANAASYREAFVAFVWATPDDHVLPSFEAAVQAVRSTASDYAHATTARPLSCDVERAAADRSAKPTAARHSRGCSHVEARPAEVEAKQWDYRRAVGERICTIVRRNNAPMSKSDICHEMGKTQVKHAAEAFANLLRRDVLRIVDHNKHGKAMYWFRTDGPGHLPGSARRDGPDGACSG